MTEAPAGLADPIGARVPRPGIEHFAAGRGRYIDDLVLPRMAHVAFLRSPFAHAPNRVRLAERRGQAGGTLSGGEQQMLALGRGLMARPTLLLLDEPTLGLAPLMAESIFAAIETLVRDGITVLIAEQDVGRTLGLSNAAYVIENGRIVKSGSGQDLLGDPDVKKAYLGL